MGVRLLRNQSKVVDGCGKPRDVSKSAVRS